MGCWGERMTLSRSCPSRTATLGLHWYSFTCLVAPLCASQQRGAYGSMFNSLFIYGTNIINNISIDLGKGGVN